MQRHSYQKRFVLKEDYNNKNSTILFFLLILFCFFPFTKFAIASKPIDMVILLDRSGSMRSTDPEGLSISAASFVVDQLSLTNENNRVAIVTFSSQVYILGQKKIDPSKALSSNFAGICEMLSAGISKEGAFHFRELSPDDPNRFYKLLKKQLQIGGYTELGMALELAGKILSNSDKDRKKMILLISDGKPEPNIHDQKRLVQLIKVVGQTLIKRIKKRFLTKDIRRLDEIYADYVLKEIIPSLANQRIEIYPVAFHKRGETPEALVDYLKKIKKITTGDENIIIADSQNLIPKLVGFIPSGINHVQIGYFSNFIENSPSIRTTRIKIPNIALKSRFFLFYKDARRSQKVRIQVYRGRELIADSRFPERSAEVIFTQSRKGNGGLVFQSIKIESPERSHGNFMIRVLDESPGRVEGIPNADLLIDTQCKFIPNVEIEPEPIRAKSPFKIRIELFARLRGQDIVLPIKSAYVFLVGRKPDDILGYMKRITNITYRRGIAILNSSEGLSFPGKYEMHVKLLFQPQDSNRTFPTYFSIPVKVTSALPLQGNVWIAKRKIRGIKQNISVVLPPIGERFKVVYRELEVRTSLPQIIDGLKLVMPPLQHSETGTILGSLTKCWSWVEPKSVIGLCNSHPIPVKIIVSIPSNVLSDLPDGLYTSTLELKDGVEVLYTVPVSVWVSIPRFVTSKEQIKQAFNPEQPFIPVVKKSIFCPGKYVRKIKIRLWSTSLPGANAGLIFENPYGIETMQDEEKIRIEKLLFIAPKEKFDIPGRNSRSPGTVFALIKLEDPSLNGKTIYNIGYVTAPHHRELPVKFVVRVKFISPWMLRIAYLLIAIIGMFLIKLATSRLKFKHLFKGKKNKWSPEKDNDEYELKWGRKKLGSFVYENESFYFVPSGTEPTWRVLLDQREEVHGNAKIEPGDSFVIGTGKNQFKINILDVDTTVGFCSLCFQIEKSPLGKGILPYLYLLGGIVLIFISIVHIINPYLIMKILKL